MRGATNAAQPVGVWPTVIGLVLAWAAAIAGQVWVFALLFIAWALFDMTVGESNFVQRITRDEHPVLFFAIVCSWIAMSVLWMIYS